MVISFLQLYLALEALTLILPTISSLYRRCPGTTRGEADLSGIHAYLIPESLVNP